MKVCEAYCPFCKEDYNTIHDDIVKCMGCCREYPVSEWADKVEEAKTWNPTS